MLATLTNVSRKDCMKSSDKMVIEAAMSYTGSRKRIMGISDNTAVKIFVLAPIVLVAWCFVFVWYLVFGILVFPYRLIRRGSRKQKKADAQHREVLEALRNSKTT